MLNSKRNPCIPPIIHDNKFVTDFSKKADLFNSFFAKQCSIIENNSVLPSLANPIPDQYLANTEFAKDCIKRIICKPDLRGYTFNICDSFMTYLESPVIRKFKTMVLRKQRIPIFLTFLTP